MVLSSWKKLSVNSNQVMKKRLRTADNMSDGCTCVGCSGMGDAILAEI